MATVRKIRTLDMDRGKVVLTRSKSKSKRGRSSLDDEDAQSPARYTLSSGSTAKEAPSSASRKKGRPPKKAPHYSSSSRSSNGKEKQEVSTPPQLEKTPPTHLERVLQYWTEQVLRPDAIFQGDRWNSADPLQIEAGDSGLYFSFSNFLRAQQAAEAEQARESTVAASTAAPPPVASVNQEDDENGVLFPNGDALVVNDLFDGNDQQQEDQKKPKEGGVAHLSKVSEEICTRVEFIQLCKLVIPQFKVTRTAVALPCRAAVSQCLRRLTSLVFNATDKLQTRLTQIPTAYASAEFHALHLLVTPAFTRDDACRENSVISFYNVSATGRLSANDAVVNVRLGQMPELHPMFAEPGWLNFIYSVAGLACLHNLYIYFRFDAARHHQYVFVHDQSFQVISTEEDSIFQGDDVPLAARYSVMFQNVRDDDPFRGDDRQWICDVDMSEHSFNGQEETIASKLPTYRGLRIRLVFRQDYSKWFL